MKISNSKKELARIISENGGWRDGAEWATQDHMVAFYSGGKPKYETYDKTWCANGYDGVFIVAISADEKIKGFHNTILSHAEYFHLYPEHTETEYKDGVKPTDPTKADDPSKPTIEQLAADYRNAKDYAYRKRQEADAAKADADEKLRVLELAGEAIGLLVSPITDKQEPILVITDWRDLQVGDVISVSGNWWEPDSEYTVDENDGSRDAPIRVGGYWAPIGECSFKFIRRP